MLCFHCMLTFITAPVPADFVWKTLPQVIVGATQDFVLSSDHK